MQYEKNEGSEDVTMALLINISIQSTLYIIMTIANRLIRVIW